MISLVGCVLLPSAIYYLASETQVYALRVQRHHAQPLSTCSTSSSGRVNERGKLSLERRDVYTCLESFAECYRHLTATAHDGAEERVCGCSLGMMFHCSVEML